MENINLFFEGLNNEASIVFIGLLAVAFLIGLIPGGLTYAFRVKDTQRKFGLLKTKFNQIQDLNTQLEADNKKLKHKLNNLFSEQQQKNGSVEQLQIENEQLYIRAQELEAHIHSLTQELEDSREYGRSLRAKQASLTAQLHSLKQMHKAPARVDNVDVNLLSSLRASQTKMESLRKQVKQLTDDNESLRRRLIS